MDDSTDIMMFDDGFDKCRITDIAFVKAAPLTVSLCPVDKLSSTTTERFCFVNSSTVWLPMYPAPPVTSTDVIAMLLSALLFLRRFPGRRAVLAASRPA